MLHSLECSSEGSAGAGKPGGSVPRDDDSAGRLSWSTVTFGVQTAVWAIFMQNLVLGTACFSGAT